MIRRTAIPVAVFLALAGGGCDLGVQLLESQTGQQVAEELDPNVTLETPTLVRGPSLLDLAAYYCPTLIDDPIVSVTCALTLGSPPPKSNLEFEFSIPLRIKNPNDIPVPAVDVLVAMTVFEGAQAEEVGALCISMCTEENPNCDGKPSSPDACKDDEDTINSVEEFEQRLPGLISDVLTGKAIEEIKKWDVPQGGDINLNLTFTLGVDPAIAVFEKVALQYVEALLAGRSTRMEVPISARGSVFFKLPVAGKIGVEYGPAEGVWVID